MSIWRAPGVGESLDVSPGGRPPQLPLTNPSERNRVPGSAPDAQ